MRQSQSSYDNKPIHYPPPKQAKGVDDIEIKRPKTFEEILAENLQNEG